MSTAKYLTLNYSYKKIIKFTLLVLVVEVEIIASLKWVKMKIKYLFLIFIMLTSCKKEEECVYKSLVNTSSRTQVKNGSLATGIIMANIKANLKKLGMADVQIKLMDSSFFDLKNEITNKEVVYDYEFMRIHNTIVQILCDIEHDLKNETNTNRKNALLKDKILKRSEYFDFILKASSKDSNITSPESVPKNVTANPDIFFKFIVLDSATSEPIGGVAVTLLDKNLKIITNESGSANFSINNGNTVEGFYFSHKGFHQYREYFNHNNIYTVKLQRK